MKSKLKEIGKPDLRSVECGVAKKDQLPTMIDQLSYIEDMALELKEMATQGGFETLSGIFDMASREARLRRNAG